MTTVTMNSIELPHTLSTGEGGAPFPTNTPDRVPTTRAVKNTPDRVPTTRAVKNTPDQVPTTRAVTRADSTSTQRAAPATVAVSLATPFDFISLTVNVFVVTAMIFIIVWTRRGKHEVRDHDC